MNTYDTLSRLYKKWGNANGILPLPSADDLRFDSLYGRKSLTSIQMEWLEKFQRVWAVAEDHEYKMSKRRAL